MLSISTHRGESCTSLVADDDFVQVLDRPGAIHWHEAGQQGIRRGARHLYQINSVIVSYYTQLNGYVGSTVNIMHWTIHK